jgi:DNA adenine methylase
VIKSQDGADTLFYLDPPYIKDTRAAKEVYSSEMDDSDHAELLDLLSRIEGKFMLSGYRNKMYKCAADRYGWNSVDFDLPNNSSGSKKKRRMTETVWTNYQR